jgi:4-coumarate--CoA ligase
MAILQPPYPPVYLPSQSLWSFLLNGRQHDSSLPAYIEAPTGHTLTRADVRKLTLELAHGLRAAMPHGERASRGDTVMIFSPNSISWPIVALGILANGSRITPANVAYTSAELKHQYTDSGARLMFVHPGLVNVALGMFKLINVPESEARKRMIIMELGRHGSDGMTGLQDLLGKGSLPSEELFDGDLAHETALLCYSSGTTGKPKGVEVCHIIRYALDLEV